MLLVKYGRSDLVKQAGLGEDLDLDEVTFAKEVPKAEELATDLEKLGPTFIKLGQLLSTRADLFPPPYLDALNSLQDQIAPFSYEEVDALFPANLVCDSPKLSLSLNLNRWPPLRSRRFIAPTCETGALWSSKFSGRTFVSKLSKT